MLYLTGRRNCKAKPNSNVEQGGPVGKIDDHCRGNFSNPEYLALIPLSFKVFVDFKMYVAEYREV